MNSKFVVALSLIFIFLLNGCKEKQKSPILEQENSAVKSQPELKTVSVNDYDINYIDIGKGEPVVFVHGTIGDYRTWNAQMDVFSKNHRVIALSRRYAHPNSQIVNDSTDYRVTVHSKDLIEFLKTLNIGPVHLVGHSYGAFTSLLTTLGNPELVKSLTLGEPPVMSLLQYVAEGEKLGNDFAVKTFVPAAKAFNSNNDEKAVEIFIGGVLNDSLYFSKAPKEIKDMMLDNITELKGIIFTENLFPPLSCEDINKLKTPTLLIKGDKSPIILTTVIDELSKCLENNQVAILPNASHGLEYENPEEFNKIVLEFIDNH